MSDLLIRNVPPETMRWLKEKARLHGRSLQLEALAALEAAARPTGSELISWLESVRPVDVPSETLQASLEAGLAEIRHARDTR